MNKTELVAAVAEKAGMTKEQAKKAVAAVEESVVEALVKGDKVQLVGFGTFEVKERKARMGRNPSTGEEMPIAASKGIAFKAGKSLKDSVAE